VAHDNLKIESEKYVQDIKSRSKEEISELAEENHRLQLAIDEQKDQESIRRLRRELDDQKRRLTESQTEVGDLRKERDQLKMDRNDLLVKQAKEIDEERC